MTRLTTPSLLNSNHGSIDNTRSQAYSVRLQSHPRSTSSSTPLSRPLPNQQLLVTHLSPTLETMDHRGVPFDVLTTIRDKANVYSSAERCEYNGKTGVQLPNNVFQQREYVGNVIVRRESQLSDAEWASLIFLFSRSCVHVPNRENKICYCILLKIQV